MGSTIGVDPWDREQRSGFHSERRSNSSDCCDHRAVCGMGWLVFPCSSRYTTNRVFASHLAASGDTLRVADSSGLFAFHARALNRSGFRIAMTKLLCVSSGRRVSHTSWLANIPLMPDRTLRSGWRTACRTRRKSFHQYQEQQRGFGCSS